MEYINIFKEVKVMGSKLSPLEAVILAGEGICSVLTALIIGNVVKATIREFTK